MYTGGAGIFCCVRTVTPHEADATSISVFVLVGEAWQPITILRKENKVIDYLVEYVNAGHAGVSRL